MAYTTPTPNTDPNNFGTVDQTLDPSMSTSTIQSKIDLAGDGGVIQWGGITSASYLINTDLRFLPGQKLFATQGDGIKVKCTNTSSLAAFIDLRSPKGRSVASDNVTISDLEFWGHTNVPNRPPTSAPKRLIVPYTGTFLRRVGIKGAAANGIGGQGDRGELGVVIDTCEIAYCVDNTVDTGLDGGLKLTQYGVKGSPVGSACTIQCCEVHHNWQDGLWWDIGAAGVQMLANNVHDNTRYGIHWEVGIGPVLIRDNTVSDSGSQNIRTVSAARGDILNNTVSGTGAGIRMLLDDDPTSRDSLTWASGTLAQPGQNQGYQYDLWNVKGNVLNGLSAQYQEIHPGGTGNLTANLSSDPRPGVIIYSTTHYTDPGGGGGGGAITVSEPVAETVDGTNATSYTIGPFTPPANALLVVHSADTDLTGGSTAGATISDTGSHVWTAITGTPFTKTSTDLYRMDAWWTTTGASPGSMTVTVGSYSQNQNSTVLAVLAFAGADLVAPSNVVMLDNGQVTPDVSLPAPPDATSVVVVFNQMRRNPPAWTPEAGWTTHVDVGTDGPNGVSLWSKTGDQQFTATGGNGASWSLMYEVATTTASPITITIPQVTEVDSALPFSASIPQGLASPYIIAVDFTTPLDQAPSAWTDVTAFVRAFDTRRGRNHELGSMQAGEASLTLDNRDRRFDPTYTSSPYYPNVVPMRHLRISTSTPTGGTFDLFSGFVEDWGQQWSGPAAEAQGDATCEVQAVDAFKLLNLGDITTYGAVILDDEPLSYWPMDDDPSGTLIDLGGQAPLTTQFGDASAMNAGYVHGPLLGGTTAASYEGTTNASWRTDALGDEAYQIQGDFTAEGWFYLPLSFATTGLMGLDFIQGGNVRMRLYVGGDRRINGSVMTETGTTVGMFASLTPLTQDAWHHVAWVRRGSTVYAYADGVELDHNRVPLPAWGNGNVTLAVDWGEVQGFVTSGGGRMAHISIYAKALTAERIATHASTTMGPIAKGTRVDAAVTYILDALGWPTVLRDIGAAGHTVAKHEPDPNALSAILSLVEQTDGGLFHVAGDGALTLRSSDDLRSNPNYQAVWGDQTGALRYSALTLRNDDQDLYPEVRAKAEGLADAVATDPAGQLRYGRRTLETDAGHLETQAQLVDRANGYLWRYHAPKTRPESLVARSNPTWPARLDEMFASDIARRIVVTRHPPGGGSFSTQALIEGVSHASVQQMAQIETTLNLVPVDDTPWILGDATYGKLGDTTALGW